MSNRRDGESPFNIAGALTCGIRGCLLSFIGQILSWQTDITFSKVCVEWETT